MSAFQLLDSSVTLAPDDALAGAQIRLCVHPDDPQRINRYLAFCERCSQHQPTLRWAIWRQAARLLLSTASDRELPLHWRCLCLDHLHRPLASLGECAGTGGERAELRALRWQLTTLELRDRWDGA